MGLNAISATSRPVSRLAIVPELWEVAALVALTVVGAVLYAWGTHAAANVLLPLGLGAVLGAANWRMARSAPSSVLTPLFAFRTSVLAFYSIGSLVPYVVGEAVQDHIYRLYYFSPGEAAKINLIWLGYTAIAIGACRIVAMISPAVDEDLDRVEPQSFTAIGLGSLFFVVGFTFTVAVNVSVALQLMESLPNMISLPFEAASGVGVFLISLHGIRRGGGWYLVIAAILFANLAIGLLLYNKSLVLFPILFTSLAVLVDRITVGRVLAVGAAMVLTLSVLQPAVARARELHARAHANLLVGGTLSERANYAVAYWRDPPEAGTEERGRGLSRLSFLSVSSFVVAQHDLGMPGDSISAVGYALIPRFIWPDKPEVSAVSTELSWEVKRQDTDRLSPTVAVDMYWNFGWTGLALLSPLVGFLLWIGTRVSYRIVRRQDWMMMPFVLIAFQVGLSADGYFVLGIVAPTAAAVIAYYLLLAAKAVITFGEQPNPPRHRGRGRLVA